MYHLFLGNTTYTILLAVTAIVVGRIIGPDGYGLYTVALIVPSFLFTAIRLGLDSAASGRASFSRPSVSGKHVLWRSLDPWVWGRCHASTASTIAAQ